VAAPPRCFERKREVERRGLVGGRRFGPGKRRRRCVVCGKGPWCCWTSTAIAGEKRQCDRKRQSSDHAACARVEKAQRRSCPALTGDGGSPFAGSVDHDGSGCSRHHTRHPLGSEMPLAAIRRHGRRCCPNLRTRVRGKRGRAESGGRTGESPTLKNRRIQQVLVDNKLVAEIGNRCLLLQGRQRSGADDTKRSSERQRPIAVTGGKLKRVKGCHGCSDDRR
jgi:hypothetical protein